MDNLLFSYFEYVGTDYDADMAAIAADPATQEWRELCEPRQQPLEETPPGDWWRTLPEVSITADRHQTLDSAKYLRS